MPDDVYLARDPWNSARPGVLVIACSDGRVQEPVDEFLATRGVTHYDRLYVPGGPGALTSSGVSFMRADQFRRECAFLIEAHGVADVYLIFHGPAEDGPAEATCADYRLKLPHHTPNQIRAQQQRDSDELLRHGFGWNVSPRVLPWRCEVTAENAVQFVSLASEPAPFMPAPPLAF
jgi:hypothetical protein